jgi:Ni,Fe-hydrogenase I cytochrome b subunit
LFISLKKIWTRIKLRLQNMAALKVYVLLFTAFFSGLMQLSISQDTPAAATVQVVDATAIDQAIAYLLMFAALFVTYFSH